MQETIIQIIGQFGYVGVFLLIMIENIFPPIPSEVILAFGGFLTTYSKLTVWGVVLASTVGSVAGAVILYGAGRLMNADRLGHLLDGKWGAILHLKKEDVQKAEKWFMKRGNQTVFFCRFIPIVRSLISIPAGVAKMRLSIFLPLTICGSALWNTVLVLLGRAAGAAWGTIVRYFDVYSMIAAFVLAAAAIVILIVLIKTRILNKGKESKEKE